MPYVPPPELAAMTLDQLAQAVAERRLPPVDGLAGGRLPHGSPNRAWLSRDLLEVGVREGGREGGGRCGF